MELGLVLMTLLTVFQLYVYLSTVIVSDLGFDISSDGTSCLNEVGNSTTIPTMNIVKMIYINVDTKKL